MKSLADRVKEPAKLTRKQAAFVRHLVENPKESATEAAYQTYDVANRGVAEQIAFDNLRKPSIVTELSKYNNLVENTLINTLNDYKDSTHLGERSLAIDTAKYVHDKIHGKAKQSLDIQHTKVSIQIDLTALPSQEEVV